MRILILAALLSFATANPTQTWKHVVSDAERSHNIAKRAAVSDVATLGFATLNGGTTGGSGGTVTTVSTLAQFTAAVGEKSSQPAIVVVQGVINGTAKVRIGSNKSIIGLPGAGFHGIGLLLRKQKNLIIRNIVSSSVVAANGDALTIDGSTNVWVDHCEFYSAKGTNKDFYDGLVDANHGADFITVSHTYFHDHWKTSLVGHSDDNASQDKGHLRITFANNHWKNCGSRAPSIRFGTGHIYNSFYEDVQSAINTRMGAQVVVESNVFKHVTNPITSDDSKQVGYAIASDNDLGGAANRAPNSSVTNTTSLIPYQYSLLGTAVVAQTVPGEAGATLDFGLAPSNGTSLPPFRRSRVRNPVRIARWSI